MHRFLPSSAIVAALASALLSAPAAAQQAQPRNQPAQPAPQAAPQAPQAAPQAPPGMTAERFGDWVVLCPKPKEAPPGSICFMTQEVVDARTRQDIAAIAIGKPPNRPNPMIGFNVPPQIDPKRPIGFRIDQGKFAFLNVGRCDAQKCSSESGLPKEMLDQLVKGKEAMVLFAVPNQERPIGVAFSLKGFGAAFKALDRKRG